MTVDVGQHFIGIVENHVNHTERYGVFVYLSKHDVYEVTEDNYYPYFNFQYNNDLLVDTLTIEEFIDLNQYYESNNDYTSTNDLLNAISNCDINHYYQAINEKEHKLVLENM